MNMRLERRCTVTQWWRASALAVANSSLSLYLSEELDAVRTFLRPDMFNVPDWLVLPELDAS